MKGAFADSFAMLLSSPAIASGAGGEMFPRTMGFKLRRLQLGYNRLFQQHAGNDTIPTNQIGALALISRNPGITPGDLAGFLMIDAAQLTAILKQLVARSLVQRKKSAYDNRSHLLFTTASGEAEYARLQTIITGVEAAFFDNVLDGAEIAQLENLIDRLILAVRARQQAMPGDGAINGG